MNQIEKYVEDYIKTQLGDKYYSYKDNFLVKKHIKYYINTVLRGRGILKIFNFFTGDNLKNKRVLDCGCGCGGLSVAASEEAKEVVSIDMDTKQMNICRHLLKDGNNDANVIRMDAAHLGFPDDYFDVIFCIDVLEHTTMSSQILRELRRVLKKDGKIFIKVSNKLFPFEPHTYVPFLSYYPKPLRDKVIKKFEPEFFSWYSSYDEINLPMYNNIELLLRNYKSEIFFSFGDFIPFVNHVSPHSPVKFRLPSPLKNIFSSKNFLYMLSKKPFLYFAKDWYILCSH